MLKITKGKTARALKVVVYGSEGIGKTTFSADAPDPLFIDTEGSTAHMDVRRIEKPESWDDLVATVKEVAQTPDICKTLVLDTADWAEGQPNQHAFHLPFLNNYSSEAVISPTSAKGIATSYKR